MSDEHQGEPPTVGKPATAPVSSLWLWAVALVAGVAAGFASWYVGERYVNYYRPAMRSVQMHSITAQEPVEESQLATQVQNAALAFAILGGTLGLAMGLAGGLARDSLRAGVMAAILGAVLASLAGYVTSLLGVPIFQRWHEPLSHDLGIPLLNHGGIWAAVGAMSGLAFGIGIGGWGNIARALQGGLVGGLIGAAFYELVGAGLFPFDKTYEPLSTSSNSRMLARMAVTIFVAAGTVIAVQATGRKRAKSSAPLPLKESPGPLPD